MKKHNPLVTIVTPSYNQAQFLPATIESVLGQNYPNIEYIIIDGGSDDGSLEVIQQYAHHLSFWISQPDQGQSDAINKGLNHAHGEVLAYLNSDDTLEPKAVAEAVVFLQDHPEVGMVYGDANFIDQHGRVIGRFPAAQTNYRRLRRGYVHIPQAAAFWRADLYHQVGPLDTSLFFAMDYDLWRRLARITTLHYRPGVWANFRLHADAKTIAADDRCWPEMIRIHRRDGGSTLSLIMVKYILRKLFAPLVTWRRRRRVLQAQEK